MRKQNNLPKGILFALVTSVVSGFAIFYSKISVAKIDPLVLATSRNFYVAMLFFLLIVFSKKLRTMKQLKRKNMFWLIVIGLVGGGIPFYLFFSGLKIIGAQTGNFIHKTLFIWVGILGMMFLKEKPKVSHLIAYLLVFVGTFLIAPVKIAFGAGEMLVLSATLLWSVENIIAKKVLRSVPSELVGLFRMGVGSLVLFALVLANNRQHLLFSLSQTQLTTIFIGGTILSFYVFFWYKALKYAPAGLATLLLTFSIVVGNVLNGGFAGLVLTKKDIASSLFIGGGTLLIYLPIVRRYVSRLIARHG